MKTKLKASCPACGRELIQATPTSEIKINCPKCGRHLQISIEERGTHILMEDEGTKAITNCGGDCRRLQAVHSL